MSNLVFDQPLFLTCPVQHYEWGRSSKDSIITGLVKDAATSGQPLAELWMGTHPKGTAQIIVEDGSTRSLSETIKKYPLEMLGERVTKKFGASLPFMLKVLSVGSALSIQAHPDKELAKQLNTQAPHHYPDTNHKPELAVALGEVELLYGFRTEQQVKALIQAAPEVKELVASFWEKPLVELYGSVCRTSPDVLKSVCHKLYNRIDKKSVKTPEENWIKKLAPLYPEGDVGILNFFFLQLKKILPGQAVFVGANIVHAHLSGEMIECMANSDNVVRAGLTPKHRDVETLLGMVDFTEATNPEVKPLHSGVWQVYEAPAEEFQVALTQGTSTTEVQVQGPEILLVMKGSAHLQGTFIPKNELNAGSVIFIPAAIARYSISLKDGFVVRAFVP